MIKTTRFTLNPCVSRLADHFFGLSGHFPITFALMGPLKMKIKLFFLKKLQVFPINN